MNESERIKLLKERLLEYKQKKQNNWSTPKGAQKRSQLENRKTQKASQNSYQTSAKNFQNSKISKFYDQMNERKESPDFLPRSNKFDFYLNRNKPEESEDQFELTGLEAQIIRSAFEETQKEKIKSYLQENRNDFEERNSLEGDILPEEEKEMTSNYIRKLKEKFENWHKQTDNILEKEMQKGRTVQKRKEDSFEGKMFLTNQRGSRLGVVTDELTENFRSGYLRKKDYESELNKYKNHHLVERRRKEGRYSSPHFLHSKTSH